MANCNGHRWREDDHARAPGTCGVSGRGRTVAMHRHCTMCGLRQRKVYTQTFVNGRPRYRGRWVAEPL